MFCLQKCSLNGEFFVKKGGILWCDYVILWERIELLPGRVLWYGSGSGGSANMFALSCILVNCD